MQRVAVVVWSERWAVRRWPLRDRITTAPMAAVESANPPARSADRYPGYMLAAVRLLLPWTLIAQRIRRHSSSSPRSA
jgi:hypothetical protein